MKRLTIVLLICVLLLAAMPLSPIETAQSDAPYIQYYSPSHDAFIIEGADGTDSRLFGGEWIPEGTTRFAGAGWSPSGEWFAFMAMRYERYQFRGLRAIAIDPSGTNHLSVLDDLDHATDFMEWFPGEDKLLVSTVAWVPDTPNDYERYVYVIDAATNTITLLLSLLTDDSYLYPWTIQWSEKHQAFFAHLTDVAASEDKLFIIDSTSISKVTTSGYFDEVSPSGWVRLLEGDATYAYNIFDKRHIQLDSSAGILRFHEPFALIRSGQSIDLLNLDTEEFFAIPTEYTTRDYGEVFSPDGQKVFLWNDDYDVFLLDTASLSINPVGVSGGQYANFERHNLHWDNEGRLFIQSTTRREVSTTILYGEEMRTVRFSSISSEGYATLSRDGNWLGTVDEGAITYNLSSDTVYYHNPHSRSYWSNYGSHVVWHPTENWLISVQDNLIAGGGDGSRWINVANVDGSVNREITFCRAYDNVCADWLPSQVNVEQLPQGQPESVLPEPISPEMVFLRGEFTDAIAWSNSGDYLQVDNFFIDTMNEQLTEQVSQNVVFPEYRENCSLPKEHKNFIVRDTNNVLSVEIFDTTTETTLLEFDADVCISGDFTTDNHYLAVNHDWGGPLQIWDLTTREMVYELPRGVSVFAISPDGTKLAAGVSWEVWIWDIEDLVGGE
ncbi:MAG: hypothetical protein L0154_25025 [Chloroflexi bacterium]|nr:hypothetical protein [Chloroflexota bacterium]